MTADRAAGGAPPARRGPGGLAPGHRALRGGAPARALAAPALRGAA